MDLTAIDGLEPSLIIEDGGVRLISHDRACEMISIVVLPGRASFSDLQFFCGALLKGRSMWSPAMLHDLVMPIDIKSIPVMSLPTKPLIKMMKAKDAERLLTKGGLRLGSIDYYRKFDDDEIGDKTEGLCTIAAFDSVDTIIGEVRAGLNDWIFCAYEGNADPLVIAKMGYDSAVEITDPLAFCTAIQRALQAKASHYSSCRYIRDRVVYGNARERIDQQSLLDGLISEALGPARAFLKPARLSHQSEYRFTWTAFDRASDYIDIFCPDIIPHLRAVKVS